MLGRFVVACDLGLVGLLGWYVACCGVVYLVCLCGLLGVGFGLPVSDLLDLGGGLAPCEFTVFDVSVGFVGLVCRFWMIVAGFAVGGAVFRCCSFGFGFGFGWFSWCLWHSVLGFGFGCGLVWFNLTRLTGLFVGRHWLV